MHKSPNHMTASELTDEIERLNELLEYGAPLDGPVMNRLVECESLQIERAVEDGSLDHYFD